MKYSSTDRPSRNEDLIGRGMISPFGLATRPRIAEIWRSWSMLPRAPEWIITHSGLPCGSEVSSSLATSLVALVQISISSPRRSSAVMRPRWYCLSIRSASFSYRSRISRLRGGCDDVLDADGHAGPGGPVETGLLERVQRRRQLHLREALGQVVDDRRELALADLEVHERVARRQGLVEQHPTQRGLQHQVVAAPTASGRLVQRRP